MKLLPLNFSEEEFTQIMDMAACNYAPEKVALQLGVDKKGFMQLYYDKASDVRQAYDAGKLKANFNVMNSQRGNAEKGNITAAQVFLKESDKIEKASIRDRILFAGYAD